MNGPGDAAENAPPVPAGQLLALMQARRHIAPRRLAEPGPDRMQWLALVEAAATAPDHRSIRPWRFVLVPAGGRGRLGEAFARALAERDPQADAQQLEEARAKAMNSPMVALAVCRMQSPAEDDSVPDEERLVSLGAAIQNMLLAAQAMGFASGVTSGRVMASQALRELFALAPEEKAVCFVNVGTPASSRPVRPRPDASGLGSVLGE